MAKKAAPAAAPTDVTFAPPVEEAPPPPVGGKIAGPAPAQPVATPGDDFGLGGVAGPDTGVVDEPKAPEELEDALDEDAIEGLDGRLPAPQATASALLAAIPRTGEAVLYEHLLLEANVPYEVAIDAREPFRRKGRHR